MHPFLRRKNVVRIRKTIGKVPTPHPKDDEIALTQKFLSELIRYEQETGFLFWKRRDPTKCREPGMAYEWNLLKAGRRADRSNNPYRYQEIRLFGRNFGAHRVIWRIVHGVWPDQIDHINGDVSDNRLINIRNVSAAENAKNRCLPENNTSGRVGVSWSSTRGVWVSSIGSDGGRFYLGSFSDFDAASSARGEAERFYGFHPNHGRQRYAKIA